MSKITEQLNEHAVLILVTIGLGVLGLLFTILLQISDMRQELSTNINEARLEGIKGRQELSAEISGVKERMGALEGTVRGLVRQKSASADDAAEPSTARTPSPERTDQARTSALP